MSLLAIGIFPDYAQEHYMTFTPNAFWSGEQTQVGLRELGLPVTTVAWYNLVLETINIAMGAFFGIFFLRYKSEDWFGLYLAFVFLMLGTGGHLWGILVALVPALSSVVALVATLGWQLNAILFYVFPDGCFVP